LRLVQKPKSWLAWAADHKYELVVAAWLTGVGGSLAYSYRCAFALIVCGLEHIPVKLPEQLILLMHISGRTSVAMGKAKCSIWELRKCGLRHRRTQRCSNEYYHSTGNTAEKQAQKRTCGQRGRTADTLPLFCLRHYSNSLVSFMSLLTQPRKISHTYNTLTPPTFAPVQQSVHHAHTKGMPVESHARIHRIALAMVT
jgi:hypothetical protein